jgi:Family of unknown function (DUF6476)
MRGLTIFVAVMGVVIVLGFAVVIATIAGRLARGDGGGPHAFTAPPIAIPKGARVAAMTAGANRLVLRLELAGGGQEIVIIDLASGRRLGTIALNPQ